MAHNYLRTRSKYGFIEYYCASGSSISNEFDVKLSNDPIVLVIEDIQIEPEYRSKGYGSSMLDKFIRKNPTFDICLQAYPHELKISDFEKGRKRLIKFYERFGFKHIECGYMIRRKNERHWLCWSHNEKQTAQKQLLFNGW